MGYVDRCQVITLCYIVMCYELYPSGCVDSFYVTNCSFKN